jgi:DNA polymerase-3 subunit alpha
VEVVIFPELYSQVHPLLSGETPVIIQAEVQKKESAVKLLAGTIVGMDQAEQEWSASVVMTLRLPDPDPSLLEKLRSLLARYPGECPAYLTLVLSGAPRTTLQLSGDFSLSPDPALLEEITELLGEGSVETRCAPVKPAQVSRKRWQNGGRGARA